MACNWVGTMVQDEAPFFRVMSDDIMMMPFSYPEQPSRIYSFLYLGSEQNAKNRKALSDLGITYVINTSAQYVNTGQEFYEKHGIKYMSFNAEDDPGYNIMQHFNEVYRIIESERKSGGKVFIHCIAGVNRSGALTIAYVMLHEKWGPITASRWVRSKRPRVLSNDDFQRQLIHFANEMHLLAQDLPLVEKMDNDKMQVDSDNDM